MNSHVPQVMFKPLIPGDPGSCAECLSYMLLLIHHWVDLFITVILPHLLVCHVVSSNTNFVFFRRPELGQAARLRLVSDPGMTTASLDVRLVRYLAKTHLPFCSCGDGLTGCHRAA